MTIVPANLNLTFTAEMFNVQDPAAVAMSVWDATVSPPTIVGVPVRATQFFLPGSGGDVYSGRFTPQNGKQYIVIFAYYNSNVNYNTLDGSVPSVTQSIVAQFTLPPVQSLIGVVDCQGGQ